MILGINNVLLINLDNISVIGFVLLFLVLFGILVNICEGLFCGIVGYIVMVFLYVIILMFLRSDKFNVLLFEVV